MDDKYYKLQDIVIETFDLDAPIEIEKGALFIDKTSRDVLLQLELNVLGVETNRVSSVSLLIDCMDDAGEIIADISPYTFTYRDIFLNKSKMFGEGNPIQLDQRVRRVKVGIQRVVFLDSSTWIPDKSGVTPPKQFSITTLEPELVEQFMREIRNLSKTDEFVYIPQQFNDYWLCTCGRPNRIDAGNCHKCGLSREVVFRVTDADYLQYNLKEYIRQMRLAKEKRLREEAEQNAKAVKKRKQRMLLTILICAFLIVVSVITFFLFWLPPAEKSAITFVTSKIESIGQVDNSSGLNIEEAEQAYSILEERLQKRVENRAVLTEARETYDELLANEVIQGISNIGEVTTESGPTINSVFDAYASLSEAQKVLVSNFEVLNNARDSYNHLRADEVIDIINSIGKVTSNDEDEIQSAFDNFNLLTDEQKALVSNYALLVEANQTYNQMKADDVIRKIKAIGVVNLQRKSKISSAQTAYNSLTPEQQALVTNYDVLQSSWVEFSNLQIANVIGLIQAIGEVDLDSESKILAAKAAYYALTPTQKELVKNYEKLKESIEEFSIVEVNNVISLIDAIGTVTIEKKPNVIDARASYEKLDAGQKQQVTNYTLLESIEQTIARIAVTDINSFIAGLNLNNLSVSDQSLVYSYKDKYLLLNSSEKSQVIDVDKLFQASSRIGELLEIERIHSIIRIENLYIFYPNSVGGTGASVIWFNKSKTKTIDYIYFTVTAYNGVGDKATCEIRHYSQVRFVQVGPFKYNEGNPSTWWKWENLWYNSTIKSLSLDKVEIEYSDGSSVILEGKDLQNAFW